MSSQGKPDYLALRVLDNNTGAELIRDLPHLHQTKWGVRAIQQGMPGSSTLGTFNIKLPPPWTEEFKRYGDTFRTIDPGKRQRVEGYLGGVIAGQPRFSGVITGMNRPMDGPWEITGVDSLWMLQQSQVLPGEVITIGSQTAASTAAGFYGTLEAVWDDDFSGWNGGGQHSSGDYNVSGWSWTGSDPYNGSPALTSSVTAPTDAYAVTRTTWGAVAGSPGQQYNQAVITISGTLVGGTQAGGVGLWVIADSTAQNGILVECAISAPTNGWYNITANIWSRTTGTYTNLATQAAFSNVTSPFPFQLSAVFCIAPPTPTGQPANVGQYVIRALLNGKDTGCVTGSYNSFTSGAIGMRFSPVAGGSPAAYVNHLTFSSRTSTQFGATWGTNRFGLGQGVFATRQLSMPIPGNGQTHLDIIAMMAALDGVYIRKTPGAGHKGDTIDFGGQFTSLAPSSAGNDYSARIVLEEGVNIDAQGTQVATVPEMLGDSVKMEALPGSDSGGSIVWNRLAATGDAVLVDTVADMGIPGYQILSHYVRAVQPRKSAPLQAQQVRVIRDRQWLSVNNGAGPRELDAVTIYMPTLGVSRQTAIIQGYDFEEGSAEQVVYLSQLPSAAIPLHVMQRLSRPIEFLSGTYARDLTRA